jgi:hypothetical protein
VSRSGREGGRNVENIERRIDKKVLHSLYFITETETKPYKNLPNIRKWEIIERFPVYF